MLVDIDMAKELKYRVLVERKGYAMFVDFEYENLPSFCINCNIVGHLDSDCRRYKPNDEVSNGGKKVNMKENNRNKGKEFVKEYVPTGKTFQEKVSIPTTVNLEKVNEHIVIQNHQEKKINEENREQAESRKSKTQETDVNEQQMGRKYASNSSASTSALEFVDATPENDGEDSVTQEDSESTTDRVQNNIKFLKDSWANLAEQAENEVIMNNNEEVLAIEAREAKVDEALRQEDLHNIEASGFQLVTNKSTKRKAQKASSSGVKINYSTRAKSSKNKPFKC